MIDIDVAGGTPGWRLHDNAMYAGRAMSVFTISLGAGCAFSADTLQGDAGGSLNLRLHRVLTDCVEVVAEAGGNFAYDITFR